MITHIQFKCMQKCKKLNMASDHVKNFRITLSLLMQLHIRLMSISGYVTIKAVVMGTGVFCWNLPDVKLWK